MCIVFLLHVRTALVAILMLPVGVLIAFIAMRLLGMNSNLMSLGGIAIAIGAMVDAAIVMIENAHKHLERLDRERPDHIRQERADAMIDACKEVGPALFFSLLIITVSFLPVFTLEAQEGRLFAPLAYTKTFAMAGAALLSVTLVPVLMLLFIRGKIMPEAKNPVNRFLIWVYRPIIAAVMRWKQPTIALALLVLAATCVPGLATGQRVHADAQRRHAALHADLAAGHVDHQGRRAAADAGQDHQELPRGELGLRQGRTRQHRHRPGARRRCSRPSSTSSRESDWRAGMTTDKLIAELDKALQFPGISNAWTMPIKARIDMLSTGIRTPIGIKVFGKDLGGDGEAGQGDRGRRQEGARHHQRLRRAHHRRLLPRTSSPTARKLARYGLSVGELQDVIGTALGGEMVTTTVEGRERFGVTVRYPRELRADPQQIAARGAGADRWTARWCRWGRWPR